MVLKILFKKLHFGRISGIIAKQAEMQKKKISYKEKLYEQSGGVKSSKNNYVLLGWTE
jgi:hypothetical protein